MLRALTVLRPCPVQPESPRADGLATPLLTCRCRLYPLNLGALAEPRPSVLLVPVRVRVQLKQSTMSRRLASQQGVPPLGGTNLMSTPCVGIPLPVSRFYKSGRGWGIVYGRSPLRVVAFHRIAAHRTTYRRG